MVRLSLAHSCLGIVPALRSFWAGLSYPCLVEVSSEKRASVQPLGGSMASLTQVCRRLLNAAHMQRSEQADLHPE